MLKCGKCGQLVLGIYEINENISTRSEYGHLKQIFKKCKTCGHLQELHPKVVVEFFQKVEEYKTCDTCLYYRKGRCVRNGINRKSDDYCPFWQNYLDVLE